VLAHPVVQCVIPGMGEARRVDQALQLVRQAIPDAFWEELVSAGLLDPAAPVPAADAV
jgi:D-threo-aldose 1-dehydrogenase